MIVKMVKKTIMNCCLLGESEGDCKTTKPSLSHCLLQTARKQSRHIVTTLKLDTGFLKFVLHSFVFVL